jgi:hypothetical protein
VKCAFQHSWEFFVCQVSTSVLKFQQITAAFAAKEGLRLDLPIRLKLKRKLHSAGKLST